MEWQVKVPTWDFDVLQVGSEPSVARRPVHAAPEQRHPTHHHHHNTWGSLAATVDDSFNPLAGVHSGTGNDGDHRSSDGNVAAEDKGKFSMLSSGSGVIAFNAAACPSSSPIVGISNIGKAQEQVQFHLAQNEQGKLRSCSSSSWQLMFREKGEEEDDDERQLLPRHHAHQHDGIAAGVESGLLRNIDHQHFQQQQSGSMPMPTALGAEEPIVTKACATTSYTPMNDGHITASKRPSVGYGRDHDKNDNGSQQINASNSKKCRASSAISNSPAAAHHHAAAPPRCQVEGCREDLAKAKKDYHRRHKVCEIHSKAPRVIASGVEQRFCQQCSRFHLLSEFDEAKRSCRKRLAGHNERRRKSSHDASALSAASIFQDDRLRHLSYLMHPLAMAMPVQYHDSCNNSIAATAGGHAALRRPWPTNSGWPGMEADHFATTLCRAQALVNNAASVGGAGAAGFLTNVCSSNSRSTASRLLSALQAHDDGNTTNHQLPLKYDHDHQMHENAPHVGLSSSCNNNNNSNVNSMNMGEGLTLSSSNGSAASSNNSSSSQGPNSNTSTDTNNNNHSMQFMASLEAAAAHHQSGLLDSGRALSLLSSCHSTFNHIPTSRPADTHIANHHIAPSPTNLPMHLGHHHRSDHNPMYNAYSHDFSAALADNPHFSLPNHHHQEGHHINLKPSVLNGHALNASPSATCTAGQQLALSIGMSANGESPTSHQLQQNNNNAAMGAGNRTFMNAPNSMSLFQALAGSNPDLLARLMQQAQHQQQHSGSTSSDDKLPSSLDERRRTSMESVELLLSNTSHEHHHLRLADTFPSLGRSNFDPSLFTAHSNL